MYLWGLKGPLPDFHNCRPLHQREGLISADLTLQLIDSQSVLNCISTKRFKKIYSPVIVNSGAELTGMFIVTV